MQLVRILNRGFKMLIKEAKIVKRKGKWCVLSHKKDKNGKYRNFGCYDTEKEAKTRLGQIFMFKNKRALLLNIMINAADRIQEKGIIHIADIINQCAEEVATENENETTAIKIMKIVNALEKRKEFKLAEELDAIIPEILDKNIPEE